MNETLVSQINNYQPPSEVLERLRPIKTVILVGITAAGKDTIIRDIVGESDEFVRVVTSTTRAPRENNGVLERHGVEYYFLTLDEAAQKMDAGEYIEVANVHERINGSLISEYERIATMGKIALSDVDYQGAVNFLSYGMQDLSVYFVLPPSFEVWLARLAKRQGGVLERDQEIITRFRSAQKELATARGNTQLIPVMNVNSDETARKIIEYSTHDTRPSDDDIAQARGVLDELTRGIGEYIAQLETDL
jgi:guanylate kinase